MLKNLSSLPKSKGLMKYLSNTSWLFLDRGIQVLLGITVGAWVARYLGPSDYGTLSFADSFVWMFAFISVLGLDDLIVRDILIEKSQEYSILGTALFLKLMGTAVLLGAVYLSTFFIDNNKSTNIIIFIYSLAFIFRSFSVIPAYFQSHVLSKYTVLSHIIAHMASSGVKIFLIVNHYPVIYFALAILADTLISATFYNIFYKMRGRFVTRWRIDFGIAKKMLWNCWPLAISGGVVTIYGRIDQVMTKMMLESSDVGYYAAAVKISEIAYGIPIVLSASLFPAIINSKKDCLDKYEARLQNLFDLVIFVLICVCAIVVPLSGMVIQIIYGNDFIPSGKLLSVHILCGIMFAINCVRTKWAIGENLQKYELIINLHGIIFNILLNYVLINIYGVIGAVYGTLLSYLYTTFIAGIFVKPMRSPTLMAYKGILNVITLKFLHRTYFTFFRR